MSYQDQSSPAVEEADRRQARHLERASTREAVARMRLQNRFLTGLDIARYTAGIMRKRHGRLRRRPGATTRSRSACWHGFVAQQNIISIKKHFGGSTQGRYIYLSGWMVAALRSEFGPLPDQSMHEKTSVPALIAEIYTFLRQADQRELGNLFRDLDAAEKAGDARPRTRKAQAAIDGFQTHVVPIIADIDAGFGNAEATYLLAKKMIEAGACALQIENQVSDEKQCGHQDGKVTVPHEDFIAKVRALPLRVPRARRGRGRHRHPHRFARRRPHQADRRLQGAGRPRRPVQLVSSTARRSPPRTLAQRRRDHQPQRQARCGRSGCRRTSTSSRAGTGAERCVLDSITSLQNGADLLWIETEKPHIDQIAGDDRSRLREVIPNAKLVYNNSPSFNWTLNFRQQVFDAMGEGGQGRLVQVRSQAALMSRLKYDDDGPRQGGRRAHPHLPGRRLEAGRHLPPPHHAADLPHGRAVDRQPVEGLFRRPGHARPTCSTSSARRSATASPA